jgi:hypothetical protein
MFRDKKIEGVKYGLKHLHPFLFSLEIGASTYVVRVSFSMHCFSETFDPAKSPDWQYTHGHETRTFSVERYALSQFLPSLIRDLASNTVYVAKEKNFFFIRQHLVPLMNGPYVAFFDVSKTTKSREFQLSIHVQSAYVKPRMTKWGDPIRFSTLVGKVIAGQKVLPGKAHLIKRR